MGINRAILNGRFTRDPELRYTPSGTAVSEFSLACNQYQGEGKPEYVSYISVVAWGKKAEAIVTYCRKGHIISVEGSLRQNRWDDQDGKKRDRTVINLENFEFMPNKKAAGAGPAEDDYTPSGPGLDGMGRETKLKDEDNPFSDDDIPF